MKVYLFGAANPESIKMIREIERRTPNINFSGFLDNDKKKHGRDFFGIPILGGSEMVSALSDHEAYFVNLITGSTIVRDEVTKDIVSSGGKLTNLIHPNVDLTMTKLGLGLYIQESVILQALVEISDNTSIHMGSLIGHESKIGRSAFIAHGVSVSGCCEIGEGTFIGANATILPRIKIGSWVTIGAGAVITKDIPDNAIVMGNPGRIVKFFGRD